MNKLSRLFSFILAIPVHFYRYAISPFLAPACRHVPSCSAYMLDALKQHGPWHGLIMGTGRILRCRPGGTHGYDPVARVRFRRYKILSRYPASNRLKDHK